jgi:hypothetical protein
VAAVGAVAAVVALVVWVEADDDTGDPAALVVAADVASEMVSIPVATAAPAPARAVATRTR